MNLLIAILGHLMTVIGAFVAIVGNTWDYTAKGIKKLTLPGRIAAVAALMGLALSIYGTVNDYLTQSRYQRIALKKIKQGYSELVVPFLVLKWEVTGVRDMDLNISLLRTIAEGPMLEQFDNIDYKKTGKQPKFGPLGYMVCLYSRLGMGGMEGVLKTTPDFVSPELTQEISSIADMPAFADMIRFGNCGVKGLPKQDLSKYNGIFNTKKMKQYLTKIIKLGELLNIED